MLKLLWGLFSVTTDNTNVNYVQYKGDYYVSTETNFMNKVDIETLERTEKVMYTLKHASLCP